MNNAFKTLVQCLLSKYLYVKEPKHQPLTHLGGGRLQLQPLKVAPITWLFYIQQEAYQALQHAAAAGSRLDCLSKANDYAQRITVLMAMRTQVFINASRAHQHTSLVTLILSLCHFCYTFCGYVRLRRESVSANNMLH